MKRWIVIGLICAAVLIYGYNGWVLLSSRPEGALPKTAAQDGPDRMPSHSMANYETIRFSIKGRSPFIPYEKKLAESAQDQNSALDTATSVPPKEDVKPPALLVTGIMWNPSKPIALLQMPDGKRVVAQQGQILDQETEVSRIDKNGIQIKYRGFTFWIKK